MPKKAAAVDNELPAEQAPEGTAVSIPETVQPEVQQAPPPVQQPPVTTTHTLMTRQQAAEQYAKDHKRWYDGYPKILAGVCEFCGQHYSKCQHYQQHYINKGEFVCMCGQSVKPGAKQQIAIMYVPHRGVFVCDSKGCEDAYYKRFSGFEKHVSWHFFLREVPFYGVQLADPVETTKL